jgi:hypothetical protein
LVEQKKAAQIPDRQAFLKAFVLSGNTTDLLDWEKLSARIARSPPPLSESEYCDRILQIANGAELTGFQWNQFVGLSIMNMPDKFKFAAPPGRIAWLKKSLTLFVDGDRSARRAFSEAASKDLNSNRIIIIPSYSAEHDRQDRVIATGVNSALVYGLWLLSDPALRYAENLCKCRYSECGAFFFKRHKTGGAPIRLSCRDAHEKPRILEEARARMRKLRKHQ